MHPERRALHAAAVLVCLALGVGLALAPAHAQTDGQTGVIHAPAGDMRGIARAGVAEFLGIPYAAPPVGDLRWRPPADAPRWANVREANKFAPTCPQSPRGVFAAPSTTEDCLYLNVFAPEAKAGGAEKRPVMVWFHGGGLFSGESNDYDGSKLARRGGVVVVTLNYRVGALGFFAHPAINAEGHANINYGLMDQQAALRWVQTNIAAFGGDPGNVTIFGQSGGGSSVMANVISPTAKGLFHRAINESGTRIIFTPPERARKGAEDFAAAAGCADQGAQCLRALSVQQVLAHQAPILDYLPARFPTPDGTIITHPAIEGFTAGDFNRVPIMTGLVADEQAYFMPEPTTGKVLTAEDYEAFARLIAGTHAQEVMNKYPLARYPNPSLAEIAMAQAYKSCIARVLDHAWARHVPVYTYEFRDRTAPSYFRPVSYPMGAYHTSELQYLFPLFHGGQGTPHPLNAAQEKLSDQLVDYWTNFARTGDPNAAGLPAWPAYSAEKDNVELLDLTATKLMYGYGKAYDCEFWDPILSYR